MKYLLLALMGFCLTGCYSNANIGGSLPLGKHGTSSSSVGVDSSGQVYTNANINLGRYL